MNFFAAASKAAFAAALINAGLFVTGEKSGILIYSVVLPATGKPVTLGAVITTTVMAVAVSGLLYFLLQRFVKRPKMVFNVLAFVLLSLSFFTPFSLPGVPLTMALLLNTMHVVVAGCVVFFFKTTQS